MKKILLILFIAIICCIDNSYAQKYGHVNVQAVFNVMPGGDSIRIKLEAYQAELLETLNTMTEEYRTKQEKFDREAGTMSPTTLKVRKQELADLETRILEFQQNAQDEMQQKQVEYTQPFQDKILQAIEDVAKENGYTYIFDSSTLLYSGGGTDVSDLVKKKLGIK